MKQRRSEMFEEYTKLALEKGLIKTAQDKESKEIKRYKDDPKARVGSDDISTIEALYGLKINPEDEKKWRNIIHQAHPEAVIISPAYDRLNGLVENENERADIIRNLIMNKPLPSGTVIFNKNAQQELIMELVRIANDLDNADEQELRVLADECLDELVKKAGVMDWLKEKFEDAGSVAPGVAGGAGLGLVAGALLAAFTGTAVLPIVGVGAVAGGIIAAIAKTAPQVKNVEENAKEVKTQLADLKSKLPEQEELFNKIDESLMSLIADTTRYQNLINGLSMKSIEGDQKSPVNPQDAATLAKNFVNQAGIIKKLQVEFDRRAKSGDFSKAAPSKALSPIYWFISDDVEDVQEAFASLSKAIDNLKSTMGAISTEATSQAPSADKSEHPSTPAKSDLAGKDEKSVPLPTPSPKPESKSEMLDKFRKMLEGIPSI